MINLSLSDVLNRRTLPPLCLYSFYVYLRDHDDCQQLLDFWLDVIAHENLCKLYCKEVIKEGIRRFSTISQDTTAVGSSVRDSVIYAANKLERLNISRISIKDVNNELRFSTISNGQRFPTLIPEASPLSATFSTAHRHRHTSADPSGSKRASQMTTGTRRKLQRDELRASVDRIYNRYIVPGSAREIAIPEEIRYRIVQAIEIEKRDDPELFEPAKEYIFAWLEAGPFPVFVEKRHQINVCWSHMIILAVLGLVCLWIGFSVFFSFIFLRPQVEERLWGIIPVVLGTINLHASIHQFSPYLAIILRTELTSCKFSRLRDPEIRQLHLRRGMLMLLVDFVVAAAVTGVFCIVPTSLL